MTSYEPSQPIMLPIMLAAQSPAVPAHQQKIVTLLHAVRWVLLAVVLAVGRFLRGG
jgi:hypothetical protein